MVIQFKLLLSSFVFLLCLICTPVMSQEVYKEFNFVKIKDGISKVGISTIIQDHNEFIWIGTNGSGLYRYDGIDYVNYKYKFNDTTSISSSLIYCSFLDSKNKLWIGTEDGINLYNGDYDQFKKVPFVDHEEENKEPLSVRSIAEDHDGNLFVGTFELGLFKLNLENNKVEKIKSVGTDQGETLSIYGIQVNQDGNVFAATDQGLKLFDSKTNSLKDYLFESQDGANSIKQPIRSLFIDKKDNFWLGTFSNHVIKINKEDTGKYNIKTLFFSNKTILSIASLSDGTMLFGTENDGLFHLDEQGEVLHNYLSIKGIENSLLSNSIWSLFVDRNERIWMGYYNMGVVVYDKLYDKFKNIVSLHSSRNSLQTGSVQGIVRDKSNNLWICTDGGGIDIIDNQTNVITHVNSSNNQVYSGLTNDYIQTIFIDSEQNKWAGSWDQGLYFLKKDSNKFVNYNVENTNNGLRSNTILSFAEDSQGTIWIGSFYNGLHSYNPETKKFTHHNSDPFLRENITTSSVRKVLVDSKDNIWLGTQTLGLLKITRLEDGTFSILPMLERMTSKMEEQFNFRAPANHILSLYEGTYETLWIGTRGAGLCKYDLNSEDIVWYNELNGLKEENISSIIESSSGEIWFGGNSGINRLDVNREIFTQFNTSDGLLSNDYNKNAVYKDIRGDLYFGNNKGVDYFDPRGISLNTVTPSLYLTDLKLFNKKVIPNKKDSPLEKVISESENITLTHSQSVFTIEYAGINYTRSEKNQYAYFLEGYEKSWNYVGNIRNATYTNLDPGNYTFNLKSANNDGVWNDTPLKLGITILPPWWKTYWALLGYMGLFTLGLFLLNRMTRNRYREKQTMESEREKRLQIEQLNENKLRFFTNISHEFRTPLTLILNPLEDIMKSKSLKLPISVKQKHQVIYKNADRLSRLIIELMDFRKLELNKTKIKAERFNLIPFVRNISDYFQEDATNREIYLTIEENDEELFVWADERMLEKIIFNILSNAFKATPEGGSITICVSLKNRLEILPLIDEESPIKVFEISIKDTGKGLKKEEVERIFERFYQVDKLNKSYYGGTGIGLEVVRDFVELHKGKVEVDSTVDVGTIFRIILPFGKEHFSEDEIISDHPVSQNILKGKFIPPTLDIDTNIEDDKLIKKAPLTLLIVEDNVELLNYLKEDLADDYKILTARNGKKGLEIVIKAVPDIIITDVIMPEMNGFDLCIKLKNDLRFSHIPILMITTKTMTDDWVEGIESGADAYMSKPFNMRVLKSRLLQLTTNRELLFNKYFSAISDVSTNTNSLDKEFIQNVLNYINDNLSDPELSVESLASKLNLSRSQFYRKIKTLTGQTANEFLRTIRLQKAKMHLEKGNSNVSQVCYEVGFSTPSYFTKCFKKQFNILPTEVKVKDQ